MVEPLGWLALGLLVLGVVGAVLPLLPGALSSLAGVLLYWYSTGYTEPGALVLVALVLVGLVTLAVDYFGGAASAKAGGASTTTTVVAAAVGVVLLFVAGPAGLVVGVAATVFVVEFARDQDARQSGRAAAYAAVGVLASTVVQALLTLSMLVAMLLVAFL